MTEGPDHDGIARPEPAPLKNLSRLTSWLTHEINNPLGGIHNAFYLIRDAVPPTHPHFKYVASIDREIARVAALMHRVHQVYGYPDKPASPAPVGRAIADALRALDGLQTAREVRVDIEIAPSAGSAVISDERQFGAIRHLMQHAIELAEPGSAIRVAAWGEDDLTWISVPARRASSGEVRGIVAGPPGLALQITEHLVRALDGKVAITFNDDSSGEIRIGLPILDALKEKA